MNPKIFLAATSHIKSPIVGKCEPHYLLESFIDVKGKTKRTDEYVKWCLSADMFLLDSGAYSFMNKNRKTQSVTNEDMARYLDDYIDFINKYDIKYFFELDLDSIMSYEKVKQIRAYIEYKTQKRTIPVWHLSRGMDEWITMCQQYDYVAIGGIATKEINARKDFNMLCEMCDIAHSCGTKVHGLGYLPLEKLNNGTCPFDTVDGTGWQGHMRATKFYIDNGQIYKEKDTALQNKERTWKDNENEGFKTWVEFSKIVEGRNG